jgi:restriction system protein
MSIPDYQSFMLPVLRLAADYKEHTEPEVAEKLAQQLQISDIDRQQRIKSGQPLLNNRIGWAITYLRQAKILEKGTQRGTFKITSRGAQLLAQNPARITRFC